MLALRGAESQTDPLPGRMLDVVIRRNSGCVVSNSIGDGQSAELLNCVRVYGLNQNIPNVGFAMLLKKTVFVNPEMLLSMSPLLLIKKKTPCPAGIAIRYHNLQV